MTELDLFGITLSLFDREITQEDIDSSNPPRELRLCIQYLPMAIAKAMRESDWSFLTEKIEISIDDDVPGFGFSHGYLIPEGIFKFVHAGTDFPYQVIKDRIYTDTDMDPLIMYGIPREISYDDVPADFIELIAYALAYLISSMLSPAGKLEKMILQRYSWALAGLVAAECHNNSREANTLDDEDEQDV